MESPSFALSGKFYRLLPFNLSIKSWWFFVLFASYSFLIYKLFTFNQYQEFVIQWKQMPLSQLWWFGCVCVLLPVNWLLEAAKWKLLTSKVQTISLKNSFKAVLAGISTGFITPNRVGELVGRVMFLHNENRKSGVTLSILNSLTQNLIMVLCGVPAFVLFLNNTSGKVMVNSTFYLSILMASLIILGLLYFKLPKISLRIKKSFLFEEIKKYTDCLSNYKLQDILKISLVSLIRYLVFCLQFYLMLRFFGVELSEFQAMIAIPTTYLFVTFTPSVSFAEAAVRSSYAVLVIGAFSGQTVNIALAGVFIWMVNFVIPMVFGSVLITKSKLNNFNDYKIQAQ